MIDKIESRTMQEKAIVNPNVRVSRRTFLAAGALSLGSLIFPVPACESPRSVPGLESEYITLDPELVANYLKLTKEAERTARTWLRDDFLNAHPLHFRHSFEPLFDYDLGQLGKPMRVLSTEGKRENIEKTLKTLRENSEFTIKFELEGVYWNQSRPQYNALEGWITNVYEQDNRISASEIVFRSIFDRHLIPNYDITKSIPEFASLVCLGDKDYDIDGIISPKDRLSGSRTQVPFESLAELADTLFILPEGLLAARIDKPAMFSTEFRKNEGLYVIPGFFFNGDVVGQNRLILEAALNAWDGRYLTDEDRLVMVYSNNAGMARLRTIEPFNTRFLVSQAERVHSWPGDK